MYYDRNNILNSNYNKILNLSDYGKLGLASEGDLMFLWNSTNPTYMWRRITYAPRIVKFTSVGQSEYWGANIALYKLVYVYCEQQYQCLCMQAGSTISIIKESGNSIAVERASYEYGDIRVRATTNSALNIEIKVLFIG